MIWQLRYRAPRSIDDVYIETLTEDEAEAKVLAQAYLDSLASPAIRFVRLRKWLVARSVDFPAIANAFGNPNTPSAEGAKAKVSTSPSAREAAAKPATTARVGL